MPRCILNDHRTHHNWLILLLKEYTFIHLPHIEGLKGNLTDEYQT